MDALEEALAGYELRVGVPGVTRRPLGTPSLVDTARLGVPVVGTLPGRLSRTVLRHMSTEFLRPRLAPIPKGTSWAYDRDTHYACLGGALAFRAELRALHDGALREAEEDDAKKICLQNGGYPGWWVLKDGLVRTNPFDYTAWVEAIMSRLSWGSLSPPNPFRRGTNHGAPSWGTSDVDALGHVLLASLGGTFDGVRRVWRSVADEVECSLDPVSTTNSRTGPLGKEVEVFRLTAAGPELLGLAGGLACRRRHVFMCPFWTYALIRPLYQHVVGAFRGIRSAGGTRTEDELAAEIARWGDSAGVWNDDISAFDQSVPYELQLAIKTWLHKKARTVGWPDDVVAGIDAWFETEQMAVVGPPLHGGHTAFIYKSKGMTKSGNLLTSWAGSVINLMRIAYAASVTFNLTRDSAADWVAHSGEVLIWGDDTIMKPRAPVTPALADKWAAASAEFGFTCKLLQGPKFLRRYFTKGTWFPMASRVLQQTIWNEHPPRSTALEILGLISRARNLQYNPMWRSAWDVILRNGGAALPQWGINDPMDLQRVFREPRFVEAVRRDAMTGDNPFLLAKEGVGHARATPADLKWQMLAMLVGRGSLEARVTMDLPTRAEVVRAFGSKGELLTACIDLLSVGALGEERAAEKRSTVHHTMGEIETHGLTKTGVENEEIG